MEQPRFEYRPNGVSLVCQIQRNCVRELGYSTSLVMPRYPNAEAKDGDIILPSRLLSRADNYYITDPLRYLSTHINLYASMLDLSPDLFYLNGPYWTAIHLASIAKKMDVPYILHVHTDIKGYALARSVKLGPAISWVMLKVARQMAKSAAKLVFPSCHYRDAFVKETGYNRTTEVLPSVLPEFKLMSASQKAAFSDHFRVKHGLPRNSEKYPLILVNGRVQKEKGLERAISNFKSLLNQCQDRPICTRYPYLVFVGGESPHYRRELEDLASSLGVREEIVFVGEVKNAELLKINQIAWLMWFVSKTDTQGLVTLEAASCGIPVMGYRHQVFGEFFPDEFLEMDESSVDWGYKTRFLLEREGVYLDKADFCAKIAQSYTDRDAYKANYGRILERAISR